MRRNAEGAEEAATTGTPTTSRALGELGAPAAAASAQDQHQLTEPWRWSPDLGWVEVNMSPTGHQLEDGQMDGWMMDRLWMDYGWMDV